MARMKCPGCGGWYDGKKCRECLFVLFEEKEKHDHHHGVYGEPSPYTKPAQKKAPARPAVPESFPRNTKTTGPGRKLLPLLLLPVILSVVSLLFQFVSEVAYEVDNILEEFAETPVDDVAVTVPTDGQVLYEGDGFRVVTAWQQGDPIEDDIPLVMENNTDRAITVSSSMVSVNGIMTDSVFFYSSAEGESTEESTLWVDLYEMEEMGIDTVESIVLYVQAYDADTYETVDPGSVIALKTGEQADLSPEPPAGTELYNDNGILLRYLGWQETDSGEGEFWFYAENNRQQGVDISSSNIHADGTPLDTYLWQNFLPETRAWFYVWADDLSELGIDSLSEIETLEFSLFAEDFDSMEEIFSTDTLQIDCTP